MFPEGILFFLFLRSETFIPRKLKDFFGERIIWNDCASFFAQVICIADDDFSGAGVFGVNFTVVSANHKSQYEFDFRLYFDLPMYFSASPNRLTFAEFTGILVCLNLGMVR